MTAQAHRATVGWLPRPEGPIHQARRPSAPTIWRR